MFLMQLVFFIGLQNANSTNDMSKSNEQEKILMNGLMNQDLNTDVYVSHATQTGSNMLNPEVRIATVNAAAGQVLVSLEMLNFTANVNSFTFKIVADASILQFVELTNKTGFTGPNYQAFQNGNLLSIVYYDLGAGYQPNGKIFDMKFNFSGTADGSLTFQATGNEVTAGIFPIDNISYTSGMVYAIPTNQFIITASAGANGSISPSGSVSVPENSNITFTISAAAGYQIAQVLVDGSPVGTAGSYTFTNVTSNHSISASFTAQSLVIQSTTTAGGSINPAGTINVTFGSNQSFTITPDPNYHVSDVLVDGVSVGALTNYTFSNVTANHTIAASFAINTSVGAVTTYTFSNVTANHTIAASFAINTYTITASAGPNGTISPSGAVTVNYGANQTFNISPAVGFTIANVLVDGVSVGAVSSYTFTNVTANHTITASFASNTFTITATAGANGTISPSGAVTVNYGANQTFNISPAVGFTIANVLVDGVSVGALSSYTFTNVTANHTITASFAQSFFTITASAGLNGSISPAGTVTVNYGANQSFTITPNNGYHVAELLVDGVSVGALTSYTFSNVTANHTIAASFSIDTFVITATAGDNGTISPSGTTTVNYGGSQAYNITPATGYHVADVLVDGVSVGAVTNYTFSNVTANHIIAASFAINTYTITATSGANGSISPSGTTTVNYGESQTYSITPAAGYHVADVLVDGVSAGAITTYTFSNVTANHTIAASFTLDSFVITASAGDNGSINPSGLVTVNYGDSQIFEFLPAEGFKVYAFWVDNDSIGDAGSYTFTNVMSNHSIEVQFSLIIGQEEKPDRLSTLKTWPSPVKTHLYLSLDADLLSQSEWLYVITDLNGKKVIEGKLEKLTERIDLSSIQSGLFLLQLWENGQKVQTVKVMKM